jgi:hypothetical protein
MAERRSAISNPTEHKLDSINSVLQDIFILQARLAGVKKDQVRTILGVGAARVTRIWKEIPNER